MALPCISIDDFTSCAIGNPRLIGALSVAHLLGRHGFRLRKLIRCKLDMLETKKTSQEETSQSRCE